MTKKTVPKATEREIWEFVSTTEYEGISEIVKKYKKSDLRWLLTNALHRIDPSKRDDARELFTEIEHSLVMDKIMDSRNDEIEISRLAEILIKRFSPILGDL